MLTSHTYLVSSSHPFWFCFSHSLPSAVAAKALKDETSREGRDTESLKSKVLDFDATLTDVKEGQDIAQLLLGKDEP